MRRPSGCEVLEGLYSEQKLHPPGRGQQQVTQTRGHHKSSFLVGCVGTSQLTVGLQSTLWRNSSLLLKSGCSDLILLPSIFFLGHLCCESFTKTTPPTEMKVEDDVERASSLRTHAWWTSTEKRSPPDPSRGGGQSSVGPSRGTEKEIH